MILSVLFLLALTVYIYLPIRTHVGAAIHWGDPDNLSNFMNVISGKSHRSSYVFNKSIMEYIIRSKEAFWTVIKQYGIIILFVLWGFIRLHSLGWKIFYLGIIVFDFFYTIFLNTVNIEITPFDLPSIIVIAILAGVGISDLLKRCREIELKTNVRLYQISSIGCLAVPAIFLISNYKICDQSRNYIAHEHAVNIFRTVNHGGTIFIDGDNNLFPLTYSRIVERMREDVTLYDRYNLFFRIPYMGNEKGVFVYHGNWYGLRNKLEKEAIEKRTAYGVYFSVFNPYIISMPDNHDLIPYGILSKVISNPLDINQKKRAHVWNYYATESLEDSFYRDYMNREVTAFYHLNKGSLRFRL